MHVSQEVEQQLALLRDVFVFHGMVQCAAGCCTVLQCVAVCCSVLQCAAICCSVCCRVLFCVAERCFVEEQPALLRDVVVFASVLQ